MAQAESAHTTSASNSSRADRFLSRVDQHLSTIPTEDARHRFIAGQMCAWQARYSKFIATDGASEPVTDRADPPSAADFLLTITGLQARVAS